VLTVCLLGVGLGGPDSSTQAASRHRDAGVGEARQVGSLATPRHPDFDVVEEPARKVIHFIGTESRRLRYMKSTDGGLTWSSPEDLGAGWAARMATDSKGNVHLVYGTDPWDDPADPPENGGQASTGWYRVRSSEGWSVPVALRAPAMDFPAASVVGHWITVGHRIAVDGNDNVHLTYYAWPENYKTVPWKELQRTVYLRKPGGAASFEPAQMLRHGKDEKGGGAVGDLVVDRNGDVHLLYGSWNGSEWWTTHVVRKKDGSWEDKIHDWIQMTSDYSMKAAIGLNGLIHVAGFDDKTLSWIYCNNRHKPDVMRVIHVIEDDWEVDLEILVTPNNDVWMSRDNHYRKVDPQWPARPGGYRDNTAFYVHFDATTSTWGPRTRLSPAGAQNSDATKHLHAPKFIYYDGSVRIFYAERKEAGDFKYYQRTLSGPRPLARSSTTEHP